jgi:hypothetical protein
VNYGGDNGGSIAWRLSSQVLAQPLSGELLALLQLARKTLIGKQETA